MCSLAWTMMRKYMPSTCIAIDDVNLALEVFGRAAK